MHRQFSDNGRSSLELVPGTCDVPDPPEMRLNRRAIHVGGVGEELDGVLQLVGNQRLQQRTGASHVDGDEQQSIRRGPRDNVTQACPDPARALPR